jgi:hypothetical protein
MIKRQMYGCAEFALLRHRILLGLRHKPSPPKVQQSRNRHPQGAGAALFGVSGRYAAGAGPGGLGG